MTSAESSSGADIRGVKSGVSTVLLGIPFKNTWCLVRGVGGGGVSNQLKISTLNPNFGVNIQLFKDTGIYTVCPGSSDPFYIVGYYINGSVLPGHTV